MSTDPKSAPDYYRLVWKPNPEKLGRVSTKTQRRDYMTYDEAYKQRVNLIKSGHVTDILVMQGPMPKPFRRSF